MDGTFDLTRFDARHASVLKMIADEAPGRRLLEVGCGAGFFLKAAARAGWHVEGIELSTEASRFAVERLELPIRRERAEDAPIEPASFDAAAMFDVIEHLFDPRAVARGNRQGARAGRHARHQHAQLRFREPVPARRRDWAVLSPLEHVYYFSEDSLRRLLEATGFSDVRFVTRARHVGTTGNDQLPVHARARRAPRETDGVDRACGWGAARAASSARGTSGCPTLLRATAVTEK